MSRHDFSSIGDYGLHWHDCFEMELMVSGSGEETINGRKYHVGPGDIVMMTPTDCHSYHMREKGVLYNVMFHGSLTRRRVHRPSRSGKRWRHTSRGARIREDEAANGDRDARIRSEVGVDNTADVQASRMHSIGIYEKPRGGYRHVKGILALRGRETGDTISPHAFL